VGTSRISRGEGTELKNRPSLTGKMLGIDKIRYQCKGRGDHYDYRANNGEVFLEFIVREIAHQVTVIGQLDQIIKNQGKGDGIDGLGDNRHFEQRQVREDDNHTNNK
jgi:hypothetical protein